MGIEPNTNPLFTNLTRARTEPNPNNEGSFPSLLFRLCPYVPPKKMIGFLRQYRHPSNNYCYYCYCPKKNLRTCWVLGISFELTSNFGRNTSHSCQKLPDSYCQYQQQALPVKSFSCVWDCFNLYSIFAPHICSTILVLYKFLCMYLYICRRPSVCLLSVTFVRPTQLRRTKKAVPFLGHAVLRREKNFRLISAIMWIALDDGFIA